MICEIIKFAEKDYTCACIRISESKKINAKGQLEPRGMLLIHDTSVCLNATQAFAGFPLCPSVSLSLCL